jgi:hypothetical protein
MRNPGLTGELACLLELAGKVVAVALHHAQRRARPVEVRALVAQERGVKTDPWWPQECALTTAARSPAGRRPVPL